MSEPTAVPPPPPFRRPTWGLGDVFGGMAITMVLATVALSIALALTGRQDADVGDLPISLVAYGQLGQWIGMLGVPLLVTRLKGSGLVQDLRLRFERRDLLVGLGWGALLQLVAVPLVSYPWIWLLGADADELEERARLLSDRADTLGAGLLLVLVVGVGAPIFEEIFYRGFALQAFRKRGLGPAVAIVCTSLLFAVVHFSVVEGPALFVFALGAGYLAHRYDRLGPAIVAHMVFNLVTVVNVLVLR